MISGGDHLQWPPYGEIGTRRPKIEKEMGMEQDYDFDKAMWEWVLEQGPPQDDDVVWLKLCGYDVGLDTALSVVHRIDFGPDNIEANEELRQQTMERLAQL